MDRAREGRTVQVLMGANKKKVASVAAGDLKNKLLLRVKDATNIEQKKQKGNFYKEVAMWLFHFRR